MADEVRINAPTGNGGERLELRVGNKALGFSAKDLVSVLAMFLLGALGYFLAQNVSAGQREGFAGQKEGMAAIVKVMEQASANQLQLFDKIASGQAAIMAGQATILAALHEGLAAIVTELRTNRKETAAEITAQTSALRQSVDEQTKVMHQDHATLDYNRRQEPGNEIPLGLAPDQRRGRQEERR